MSSSEVATESASLAGNLIRPYREHKVLSSVNLRSVKNADVAAHEVGTPRPIWEAAARAARLRGQHLTLRKIAAQLEAEGFRPPRGGKWFVATVAQLLKRSEPERVQTEAFEHHRAPDGR